MATIPSAKPAALSNLGEPPPKGIYLGICLDVVDQFNVTRKKYQSEEEETVNLTRFVFGLKGKDGKTYKLATREMKISGHEKSTLVNFITAWTGDPPHAGFDTASLKGASAQISVVVNDKGYSNIGTIGPVMEELAGKVPAASEFGVADEGQEIPF